VKAHQNNAHISDSMNLKKLHLCDILRNHFEIYSIIFVILVMSQVKHWQVVVHKQFNYVSSESQVEGHEFDAVCVIWVHHGNLVHEQSVDIEGPDGVVHLYVGVVGAGHGCL